MGLEAVMICVDNSEWSRNSDYAPSRFDVQSDTANIVGGIKTGQNPETGVGLMTLAGERSEVILTPTASLDDFMRALTDMSIRDKSDFVRGIQIATLALKHRQNKNQKQRVICFVGSPVENTEKQLETLGKNLKKNNVSLDIISFGTELESNKPKLEKLIEVCNSNDTSHYIEIPVGPRSLSDVVLSSPICFGEGEGPGAGAGAGAPGMGGAPGGAGDNFEFGVDPSADPELALALRISMEEERRRQEGDGGAAPASGDAAPAAAPAEGAAAPAAAPAAEAPAAAAAPVSAAQGLDIEGFDDMDDELKQALLLSMEENQPATSSAAATDPAPAAAAAATTSSSSATGEPDAKKAKTSTDDSTNLFQDPDFVSGLLGSLPGVDLNDAKIQEAIQQVGKDDKKDEKKDDKDKKDGDKK